MSTNKDTTTFTTEDHYDLTRQPILDALSSIANLTSNEESEAAAKKMASYLVYASGESFTSLLLDLKNHTPSRDFAYLVEALGFVHLGNAENGLRELLQTFARDYNIHIREAAENACDMIAFHEKHLDKSTDITTEIQNIAQVICDPENNASGGQNEHWVKTFNTYGSAIDERSSTVDGA